MPQANLSQYKDTKQVIVKPKAYYKMLVHVLRFGNKARDRRQYKEVMGMLIARLDGPKDDRGVQNVIIEDAVPISHGGSIEVAFKPEDYVSFSYVDAQYAEHDPPLFTVGWYHSHPALNIFFSATDVKNQLGWQTEMNPSGIGIVFDHTYLEKPGSMGFKTFRLDDPSKGPMSHYHEVETIVEPPDNTEYYVKIMDLINSIHSKEPPILEQNETPDLFGDIIMPGQSQIMAKQPEMGLSELLSGLQEGITNFLEASFEPVIRFLNSWSQEIVKWIVENNLDMRKSLVDLRNNISAGMNSIQTSVKSQVTNKLYDIDAYIDDRLESFDKDQDTIKNSIQTLKESLHQQIDQIFEQKVDEAIKKIQKNMEKISKSSLEVNTKTLDLTNKLLEQQNTLTKTTEKIQTIKTNSLEKIKESQESILGKVSEKIDAVSQQIIELNKNLKDKVADFDAAVSILGSAKDSLTQKINELKNQSKTQPSGGV